MAARPRGFTALAAALLACIPVRDGQAADAYLRSLEQRISALESSLGKNESMVSVKDAPRIPVFLTPKSQYVEQLKLRGRVHWQYAYTQGNGRNTPGNNYSTMETRRAIIGVEGILAEDFKFAMDFMLAGGPGFLSDATIRYTKYDLAQPIVGLFKPRFGCEEMIGGGSLLTIERGLADNQFRTGEMNGFAIDGSWGVLNYFGGMFHGLGNGAGRQAMAIGTFNPNNQWIRHYNASVGLDLAELIGFPLEFRADYLNLSDVAANTALNPPGPQVNQQRFGPLRQNIDVSMRVKHGPFDLWAEWYYGFDSTTGIPSNLKSGRNDEYLWALSVSPSFYLIPEKLQLVTRWQYVSSGFQGVRLQNRYERRALGSFSGAATSSGSSYWAIYTGLNYYLNGNDLKLMLAHEFSELTDAIQDGQNDYRQNTIFGAVRMQF